MKIFLPTNLDLESTVKEYKEKYKEKYQWIIHTILNQNYKTKNGLGDYVNLEQRLLRKFTGERYCKEILNQLQENGIIKINPKYSVNNFCMSYKLTEEYSTIGVKGVDFTGDKAYNYIYKLNDFNKITLEKHLENTTIAQLYKNYYKIEINKEDALTHTENLLNDGVITNEQSSVAFMTISNIWSKDENYFFKVDENTGRVYHSIANCPRYLRSFLSYQGEGLVQIDIANSQPMLFYPLILEYLEKVKTENTYLLSDNMTYTYDISTLVSPYVETICKNTLPADVTRYKELCSVGLFYDDLMTEFGIPATGEERQKFKKTFFGQIFYSEVHQNWEYDLAKKFRSIYPNVYDAVMWYKKKNHADLPLMLQEVESNIVINGVCGKLVKGKNPDSIPFFCTVHDCIVCLEKDAEYIQQILEDELKSVMGFVPKVKRSAFN